MDKFIDLGDKKRVVLTDSDIEFIRDNPHGLTKEGAQVSLVDWYKYSKNRHIQGRYKAMIEQCKLFTKSGKMNDGRTILSRDSDGEPTWMEYIDTDFNRYSKREWNELEEVKRY